MEQPNICIPWHQNLQMATTPFYPKVVGTGLHSAESTRRPKCITSSLITAAQYYLDFLDPVDVVSHDAAVFIAIRRALFPRENAPFPNDDGRDLPGSAGTG